MSSENTHAYHETPLHPVKRGVIHTVYWCRVTE